MSMPKAVEWRNFLAEVDRFAVEVDEIDKLSRKALDMGATLEERRSSAMIACERMERVGFFRTLRKGLAWMRENRERFETVTSGMAFLSSLGVGRRR